MASGRTLFNALIGAVVGVVLSFIPFSTVVGGVVAGFLEGPNEREGAIVGALAGLITFLPIAGLSMLALGVLGFGMGLAAAPIEGFAVAVFVIAVLATIVFLYTVGLSLLGGYLGAYLAREYPDRRTETRKTIGLSADAGTRVREPPIRDRPRDDGRSRDRSRDGDRDRIERRERDRDPERDTTGRTDE